MRVDLNSSGDHLTIYPNPLRGRSFHITLSDLPAADYDVQVVNTLGQTVLRTRIAHPGNSGSYQVTLPASTGPGTFQVQLYGLGKKKGLSVLVL